MDSIKILIADDHPMMREALLTALAEEKDMQVVGEASDGIEALELAAALSPSVVLMDLLMPGMDGFEATAKLSESHPQIKVLVVTSLEEEDKILAAIQAGALGYFPKTAPRPYLLEAIRKVADGVPYLPYGVMLKLFNSIRKMKVHATDRLDKPLTVRQQEVLALLGEGSSDHEISQILHLTEATVRSHVHSIVQRLRLESRAQAVAYANRMRRSNLEV